MVTLAKCLLHAVGLCFFLIACNGEKDPVLAPENIFNNKDLKVITSIINKKKGTIAIVYGNDLAYKTAGDKNKEHSDGEKFEMVTWKLRPMPEWYGTDMNGEILSIETVKVSKNAGGEILFDYRYIHARDNKHNNHTSDNHKSAAFIVSQQAAVFPTY